ncbi:helical backbone metal receptor [Paenibacillus thiaminolyticus]|uniref:helical backbone metal receptor n=1 Tax=Paenibacillus thiaminolyticus TaxID=49283 RepID=UPI002543E7C0|nr:helical backbone metal receptor [Paenibacillus thiaminolyticus]WII40101.1 helical backbone metal receptor [Paenibacillus thiaminolyticus]
MIHRKGKAAVIIFIMMLAVAACGNAGSEQAGSAAPNQAAAEDTNGSSGDVSQTAEDAKDNSSEAGSEQSANEEDEAMAELLKQFGEQKSARIVTLSVSITEILHELGIEPVGLPTTNSKLPESLADVPRIGSSHQPDLEQIAKLQPDVVLGPASIKDSMEKKLGPASLPSAYLPVDSLEQLKLSTKTLGRLLGRDDQAKAFLQDIEREEREAIEQVKGKPAPKVMFLFGSAEALMLMNDNTFAGSLARNLGAVNVVSEELKLTEAYVPFNMESIVAANPDVILLVAHGDPDAVAKKFEEDVKKNGAWEKLNAFQNGKMATLDFELFGIASIVKAPDAYKEMARTLYD